MFNKNIYFNTESAKEPTTYEIVKLAPQQSLYYNQSFSRFGTHFDDRPKILTYRQKLSYENKKKSSTEYSANFLEFFITKDN